MGMFQHYLPTPDGDCDHPYFIVEYAGDNELGIIAMMTCTLCGLYRTGCDPATAGGALSNTLAGIIYEKFSDEEDE